MATRNEVNQEIIIYSNGKKLFSQFDNDASCTVQGDGKINFFRDDFQSFWSDGNVAFIGSYDSTLTEQDVITKYNSLTASTGIPYMKPAASLLVYPNPTLGKLYLNTSEQFTTTDVAIMNVCGQLVCHETLANTQMPVNIESLPSGIYLLKATCRAKVYSTTFVKQ